MRNGILAGVLGLMLFAWASEARAQPDWFLCQVHSTGVSSSGNVLFRLSDTSENPAFTKKWFRATEMVAKQMLATALTATTSDLSLEIYTDISLPLPTILNMYVKR